MTIFDLKLSDKYIAVGRENNLAVYCFQLDFNFLIESVMTIFAILIYHTCHSQ